MMSGITNCGTCSRDSDGFAKIVMAVIILALCFMCLVGGLSIGITTGCTEAVSSMEIYEKIPKDVIESCEKQAETSLLR